MAGPDRLLGLKTLLLTCNLGYKGLATPLPLPSSVRWVPNINIGCAHVKQPVSEQSRVCRRKAIVALLDQLTIFGQRESLMIHASSGSGRISAVSSAQSVHLMQSAVARWRCTK